MDVDCQLVNDCGPHGDSFAVRADAQEQAESLYHLRCGGHGFDGFPTYVPRCQNGRCAVGEQFSCCGCATLDAGLDGG